LLVELRARQKKEGPTIGVDAINGKIADLWKLGVIEPEKIKMQAIKSATEAVELLLRIDDVMAASKKEGGSTPSMPSGGMEGMGGNY
jgi:chaperonin GroEL (HSP60 family)